MYFAGTDSTSTMFLFICKIESSRKEDEFRDLMFETITKTDVNKRFNRTDKFWEQFHVRDESLKKTLGLYETKSINNLYKNRYNLCSSQIVVAINRKAYFEQFENLDFNKKHKDIRENSPGMYFENYASRLLSLNDHENVKIDCPVDIFEFEKIRIWKISNFQRKKDENETVEETDLDKIVIGEEIKLDNSIAMDNVCGLADKSNDFDSFLTVCWKSEYSSISLFHIIYPKKYIWQMIISQTEIFKVSPGLISSVLKIWTSNCHR